MFSKNSRYADVPDATMEVNGREVRYKKTRFIPETPPATAHTVTEGERLDLISYRYYRDAEAFWRIADTNRAMRPSELVQPGRSIHIPTRRG